MTKAPSHRLFAVADRDGALATPGFRSPDEAWREFLGAHAPTEADALRSACLKWVGQGYRIVDLSHA